MSLAIFGLEYILTIPRANGHLSLFKRGTRTIGKLSLFKMRLYCEYNAMQCQGVFFLIAESTASKLSLET
jgi:hypothetical protein